MLQNCFPSIEIAGTLSIAFLILCLVDVAEQVGNVLKCLDPGKGAVSRHESVDCCTRGHNLEGSKRHFLHRLKSS